MPFQNEWTLDAVDGFQILHGDGELATHDGDKTRVQLSIGEPHFYEMGPPWDRTYYVDVKIEYDLWEIGGDDSHIKMLQEDYRLRIVPPAPHWTPCGVFAESGTVSFFVEDRQHDWIDLEEYHGKIQPPFPSSLSPRRSFIKIDDSGDEAKDPPRNGIRSYRLGHDHGPLTTDWPGLCLKYSAHIRTVQ